MKRKRLNDDNKEEDRLSDLSDCVLLRILSLLKTKQAVQTCILSTRWKNLWKHLSKLSLHSSYFDSMDGFAEFAAQILSLHDHSTTLSSLNFYSDSTVQPHLLQRILKHVVSHNVRRLKLHLLYNIKRIPPCIFSCHTLTSLRLYVFHPKATIFFPDSINLPALTNMKLHNFVFRSRKDGRADPFSALKKLNRLTIRFCKVLGAQNLCISNITLANLTIQKIRTRNYRKIELYTPRLSTFAYAGTPSAKLCGSHLCSIKHVVIDAYMCASKAKPPSILLCWLKEFTEITSLSVTLDTLQVISLVPNLLKNKLHSLRNLKSLGVKMEGISSGLHIKPIHARFMRLNTKYQKKVAKFREKMFKEGSLCIPGIVAFLLQNSPSAKVHITKFKRGNCQFYQIARLIFLLSQSLPSLENHCKIDSNSEVTIETMKRERHNYDEKEEDRLSDLTDCVLLRILSFLNVKQAVQTCIMSTRWINLWKHLPILRICSSYFNTTDGFTEFISQFLSLRDDSTALYDLMFTSNGMVEPDLLERILKYAVSHNVQWMLLIILNYNIEHIPSCIFSCHTLTSLKLSPNPRKGTLFPNSLNLPALNTLVLVHFVFCSDDDGRAEPFSALKKLDSLTIWFCEVLNAPNLCISNVTLASLTIQTNQWLNYRKIELSTPSLSKFAYAGTLFEKLSGSHLCSIKHLNIDAYMCSNNAEPPSNLLSWLRALTEIKSLTVTSTTLQVLSLVPNLLKDKFHSLRNLKSLRVKMKGISSGSSKTPVDGIFWKLSDRCQEEVAKFREAIFKEGSPAIPDGMDGFLLQNSQSAKLHIIN